MTRSGGWPPSVTQYKTLESKQENCSLFSNLFKNFIVMISEIFILNLGVLIVMISEILILN